MYVFAAGHHNKHSSRKRKKNESPINVCEIEWLVRTTISILINDWNCFMLLPISWYNAKRPKDLRVMHGFDLFFFLLSFRIRSCFWIKCFKHLIAWAIDWYACKNTILVNRMRILGRCITMVNKRRKWQKEKKRNIFLLLLQNLHM